MGYGSKHVRFASRPVIRGRNQHIRSNGHPKVRHESLEDAIEVVREMRALGKDVQPYLCVECDGFHIGNRRYMDRVPDREVDLHLELGDRAFAHLRAQNGKRASRLHAVIRLMKTAQLKALYGSWLSKAQ